MKKERNFWMFLLLFTAALAIVYYQGMFCWDLLGLIGYAAALLLFVFSCVCVAEETQKTKTRYLAAFLLLFAVPFFSGPDYFGSAQMYVMIPGLLCLRAVVVRKAGRWALLICFALSALVAALPSGAAEGEEKAVFLLLMLPYLAAAVYFFCRLIKKEEKFVRAWLWIAGNALLLAVFWMPQGSGNAVFAVLFFDLAGALALIAAGDFTVKQASEDLKLRLRDLGPAGLLLLIYPLLLQPLGQEHISRLSGQILRFFMEGGAQ